MSDEDIETAALACEPCRRKKCKVGVVFPRLAQTGRMRTCPPKTDMFSGLAVRPQAVSTHLQ